VRSLIADVKANSDSRIAGLKHQSKIIRQNDEAEIFLGHMLEGTTKQGHSRE